MVYIKYITAFENYNYAEALELALKEMKTLIENKQKKANYVEKKSNFVFAKSTFEATINIGLFLICLELIYLFLTVKNKRTE